MLRIGGTFLCFDNSGAHKIKIFNIKRKKTCSSSYARINWIVRGSVIDIKPNRKFRKGSKATAMILTTKRKWSRKNGIFIRFAINSGITFTSPLKGNFRGIRNPIASRCKKYPVAREIKQNFIKNSRYNRTIYRLVGKRILSLLRFK